MAPVVSVRDLLVDRTLIGVAALGLFLWDLWLERRGPTEREERLRARLLAALATLAFASWWNFGLFHLDHYVHWWDVYHLETGAKYAPELGYTRLYACTAVAEEELGFGAELAGRQIRDLGSNRLRPAAEILQTAREECRRRFSPARWEAFRRDVAFFRSRVPLERWRVSFGDHGYNATPAWGLFARLAASLGPATGGQTLLLTLLDPLLILALWGVALATFGLRAACVGLVWWGLNTPADFGWIGGCFLRFDWLALVVFGVALLRRGRPAAAGAALAGAALLRIFPALVVAGVALKAVVDAASARRLKIPAGHLRFAAGAAATLALVIPLSGWAASGGRSFLGPWEEFVANSRKHLASPSMNNMGLRTVLAWAPLRPITLGPGDDPVDVWWTVHAAASRQRRPLFVALVAGAVALAVLAVRRRDDWVAACLGALLIPFATTVSGYYYGFLVVLGFLSLLRRGLGVAVALLATASSLIALLVRWQFDAYVLQSLAVLLVAGGTLVSLAVSPPPGPSQKLRA